MGESMVSECGLPWSPDSFCGAENQTWGTNKTWGDVLEICLGDFVAKFMSSCLLGIPSNITLDRWGDDDGLLRSVDVERFDEN